MKALGSRIALKPAKKNKQISRILATVFILQSSFANFIIPALAGVLVT